MRRPNPIRTVRQAIEDRTTEASRTAYLEDLPQRELMEQYLPQIANESLQAAKTARTVFMFYRKKRSGRRCSCFDVETSPDAFCQICYGSGFVGGWDLHGCRTEVVDVTHPNLQLVNVVPDYMSGTRPLMFKLDGNSLKGYIETDISLVRNVKVTQIIRLVTGGINTAATVKAFIKRPTETTWVPLVDQSLNERLDASVLNVRIELSRRNIEVPSPKLSHLMLRYQLIPEIKQIGNMNLSEESFEVGDLGFTDVFETNQVYVPASLDYIKAEDFFIRLSDMKRFKVNRVNRNVVNGVLLSTTMWSRLLIVGQDSLVNFP